MPLERILKFSSKLVFTLFFHFLLGLSHGIFPADLYWRGVDSSWNVVAHGDALGGMWRGNWRMQWVASILHTTSEHGVPSITTADANNSAASSRLNWRPPAGLNGLVRFAVRRNVFSARVPSYFKWSLLLLLCYSGFEGYLSSTNTTNARGYTKMSHRVRTEQEAVSFVRTYEKLRNQKERKFVLWKSCFVSLSKSEVFIER